jgi:hypothetical protein
MYSSGHVTFDAGRLYHYSSADGEPSFVTCSTHRPSLVGDQLLAQRLTFLN